MTTEETTNLKNLIGTLNMEQKQGILPIVKSHMKRNQK